MNFKEAIEMTTKAGDLAGAITNIDGLMNLINGNSDNASVIDAIKDLITELDNDFQELISCIQAGQIQEQWKAFETPLTSIYNNVLTFGNQLHTLDQTTELVKVYNVSYSFQDWAINGVPSNGDQGTGVLMMLAAYVQPSASSNQESTPSLVDLFNNPLSNVTLLDAWISYARLGATSGMSKFATLNDYELLQYFMIFNFRLVGAIGILHTIVLALANTWKYNPGANEPGHISDLSGTIANYWGDASTAGTIWSVFNDKFMSLSTADPNTEYANLGLDAVNPPVNQLNPDGQIQKTAFTQDNWTGSDNCQGSTGYFYGLPFSVTSTNVANAFVSSLRISPVGQPVDGGPYTQINNAWMLQAQLSTMGPDLVMTPMAGLFPDTNDPSIMTGWGSIKQGGQGMYQPPLTIWSYNAVSAPQCLSASYAHYLYPTPPVPADANTIKVVTGFQFVILGNQIALALQFGDLDLTAFTVIVNDATYYSPAWYGGNQNNPGYTYSNLPENNHLCPAGKFDDQGNNIPGLITNATLAFAGHPTPIPGGLNNLYKHPSRLYLNLQMAAPVFQMHWFQPDVLANCFKVPVPSALG